MPIRALQHAFRAIRLALYALEAPNNFHGGRRTTSLSHSWYWAANSNADISQLLLRACPTPGNGPRTATPTLHSCLFVFLSDQKFGTFSMLGH